MEKPINCIEHIRTGSWSHSSDEIRPEFLFDGTGEELLEHPLDAPMWTALGGMTKFESIYSGEMMHGSKLREELYS